MKPSLSLPEFSGRGDIKGTEFLGRGMWGKDFRPSEGEVKKGKEKRTLYPRIVRGKKKTISKKRAGGLVVGAQQAGESSLNFYPGGGEAPGFIIFVHGNEKDIVAVAFEYFQSGFRIVYQGDDDVAVIGSVAAFDDDGVTVENAALNHGFTFNGQGVELSVTDHFKGNGNGFSFVGNGFNGSSGGDFAIKRDLCRAVF